MSQSDSFIEEVTEEVRRDRLFALFRKYAPYVAVAIILLVGGAAFNEYRKASATAAAEALGDSIVAALQDNDTAGRVGQLSQIEAGSPGGRAIVDFLMAAGQTQLGETDQAIAALNAVAESGELPEIYRQIAAFKALTLQADSLPAETRRLQFEALAQPGQPLWLLALEQLALIDLSEGMADAAIGRYRTIAEDSGTSAALRQRASQMIVALGGAPDDTDAPKG